MDTHVCTAGDSRAVLCRAGKAIQVTDDHKPEREDEAVGASMGLACSICRLGMPPQCCGGSAHVRATAFCSQLPDFYRPMATQLYTRACVQERVEKAGGQVLFWNGHRVMGVLAMSRAIGDHGLRPYVIPEPEVGVSRGWAHLPMHGPVHGSCVVLLLPGPPMATPSCCSRLVDEELRVTPC